MKMCEVIFHEYHVFGWLLLGLDHGIGHPHNESPYRAKWPKHPNNKAFDKSGIYSKSPKVADAVIEAYFCGC